MNIIQSSQKVEATPMSIDRRMDKQNVVYTYNGLFSSVQLRSHIWLFVILWMAAHPCPSPTPGAYSKTHVHWVSDAIPPSHPLSPPSLPAFNLPQHQNLFHWVSSSHQTAKVLEFQLQHQSFQWIFRTDFFEDWLVWSPCSQRDSQESSPTPQFKSINSSALSFLLWSNSHIHTWLLEKP